MDKLAEIMEWKRREVSLRSRPVSERELMKTGDRMRPRGTFREVLADPMELAVIAEIKRKSPSAGTIAENVSAMEQSRAYFNAGGDA